jgi:hypothetical protein
MCAVFSRKRAGKGIAQDGIRSVIFARQHVIHPLMALVTHVDFWSDLSNIPPPKKYNNQLINLKDEHNQNRARKDWLCGYSVPFKR